MASLYISFILYIQDGIDRQTWYAYQERSVAQLVSVRRETETREYLQ